MHRHRSGQHRQPHKLRTKPCADSSNGRTENSALCLIPSLPSLLWHCANARVLSHGKLVHSIIVESEDQPNGYLRNHLLHMYGKCGALDDANVLFNKMEEHDAFSWSAMIDAHTQHGQASTAILLIRRMHLEGAVPNKFTFLSILPVCTSPSSLSTGKHIHTFILGAQHELDAFLGTSLINMYRKCDALGCAHAVFDYMDNSSRNVVTWTAIATAYAQQDKGKQAMQLFQQMLLEGFIPDKIFFVSIFDGCTSLTEVMRMHAYTTVTGCDSDVILKNALVNLYVKFGNLHSAWETFQDTSKRTVVSWTTLISAYAQHGLAKEALQLFQQMLLECVIPDNVTFVNVFAACTRLDDLAEGKRMHGCALGSDFMLDLAVHNAIVHFYGKSGSVASARRVFDSMFKQDLISWNAMISAYAQHGQVKESFLLFHRMCQEGIRPDKVTFISLLEGCSTEEALAEGTWVHRYMLDKRIELDVVMETALIEMYGKCGGFDCACSVFENMQERDLITWTAMMAVCTSNEQNKLALQLFTQLQMEAMLPNKVTFVSATLACANLADQKEGKRMHVRVVACDSEIDVFVGTALVDLYSKCGNVEEAWWFFENLPTRDAFSWNAMITAYAQHGDGEKALQLFCCMLPQGMLPDEVTLAVILCACNHAGLVHEAYNYLVTITSSQNIKPMVDYFIRLVDLLARAGQLSEGESLANTIPYQPCGTLWATLLGACSLHVDVDRGERAAYHAFELARDNAIPYVALSNLYAAYEGLLGFMDFGILEEKSDKDALALCD
eukprot:c23827_g4_i2 orf=311-2656(-)